MTRARKINAIIWIVIAVAIITLVTMEWHAGGCSIKSLILAATFYSGGCATLAGVIDSTIKDYEAR